MKGWARLKKHLLGTQKEFEDRNGLDYCKNCSMDYRWLIKEIENLFIKNDNKKS